MKSTYLALSLVAVTACGAATRPDDDYATDATPPASADARPELADAAPSPGDPCGTDSNPCSYAYEDNALTYTTARGTERVVIYRTWYPEELSGDAPVIVVSHGGNGSTQGHTRFSHLGSHYASRGYLSIHLNHRSSTNDLLHRADRPADVAAIVDALANGSLALPNGFNGTADAARIGHIGHSWGAYTAHAVGGANFVTPAELGNQVVVNFRQPLVKAIVALSPQGWDGFGAFDVEHDIANASADNSWSVVTIPAYNIIGALEMNVRAGTFMGEQWRRFPFVRYPSDGTKYLSVIPGQNHSDIGGNGSDEVDTFIAVNSRAFFDVYLRNDTTNANSIGHLELIAGTENATK